MRGILALGPICLLASAATAYANDWEKFYRPLSQGRTIESVTPPEQAATSGDLSRDVEDMFRKGYGLVGFSAFNSSNSKTADAVRLAGKLKAKYVIIGAKLAESHTSSIPLTLPQTTTSYNNGSASAYGSGGYAHGTYSGTTTTYGTQTTYIPITVNRYEKVAVFFGEVPKVGLGVLTRDLTIPEMTAIGTRRAIAVRQVRDGSPAYISDIFPGDIIIEINDAAVDPATISAYVATHHLFPITIIRAGQRKTVMVTVPDGWGS